MKDLTDFEIIESVKRGNQSDFSILINRYKNKAFSLLNRMLKDEMEAEEVLQDCFLKAYKGLESFKQESKFSTWFYKIVYNTALTKLSLKKRKVEKEMSSIDDHLDLKSEIDSYESEKKDLSIFVNEMVAKLPAKYSTIINMFYLDEMSCEEISQVIGISIANVKVMLHRSRTALKDILLKKSYVGELQ